MGTFDEVVRVANGLLTFVALAVVVAAGMEYRRLRRAVRRLYADLDPLVKKSTEVVTNLRETTNTIRSNVDKVSETVTGATDRVQQAVDVTEQRLSEFNALVSVLQQEAEDVFVSSAAVVHGIRAGAAALAGRGGPELASEESDRDDDPQDLDDLEEPDGDSDFSEGTDHETKAPAPRVRPRSRARTRRSPGIDG